jgi:CheY-like chemotaxis protein
MSAGSCGRRVLIVEDDSDLRNTLADVLEDGDYQALRAENGAVALAELRNTKRHPCLILLDMMMPVMDGRAFRAAQQQDPSLRAIPVIVLSAHADASLEASQMAAQGFLRKPVDLGALMETVERFCVGDPQHP